MSSRLPWGQFLLTALFQFVDPIILFCIMSLAWSFTLLFLELTMEALFSGLCHNWTDIITYHTTYFHAIVTKTL